MTFGSQSRKFKARGFEDAEQNTNENPSLVDSTAPGCGDIPNRRPLTFCFCARDNIACPLHERQVSPVMSNPDITMNSNAFTSDDSIGIGNNTLGNNTRAWEVGL
ncbi:hypothetical protein SAMN05421858_5099 [Haladaptatus litoreus]|uniref:Uncharacterized protein n=1 Tax=Haladaptatus litoreus TaxID=553468 RepID=A0A1N7FIM8_9EURY|nr:hypothetical protein SAMN05421858_5099 [Haladaptatus litoreus]